VKNLIRYFWIYLAPTPQTIFALLLFFFCFCFAFGCFVALWQSLCKKIFLRFSFCLHEISSAPAEWNAHSNLALSLSQFFKKPKKSVALVL
jgi:hypothetical protein